MQVHHIVLDHLHKSILPYVFQVQDMGIPYPAELWKGDTCESETGSVMFNIKDSWLIAEYFAYGVHRPYLWLTAGHDDGTQWRIVLKDAQVEIPVKRIQVSPKGRTVYRGVAVPPEACECTIQGWLGASESEMRSAIITITDLPDLNMPRASSPLTEETSGDGLTYLRQDTLTPVLTLVAGDWEIDIMEFVSNPSEETGNLHTAELRKADSSPFTLSDKEGIIVALRQFLSFQSGRWINTPTIVCHRTDPMDLVAKRAFLENLSSRSDKHRNQRTATDFRDWPGLFKEFWRRHIRNTRHLNNAIHHYVSCSEFLEQEYNIHYATVAARSTLESLMRWWNGLEEDYGFYGNDEHRFQTHLLKAIEKAELDKDVGREMDTEELCSVIARASKFRHRIDHGRAGNVDREEIPSIIEHQQYMHHLARMLILAKLGIRNTHPRDNFIYSPRFKEIQP